MVEQWGSLEGVLTNGNARHRYGYIGLSDRRMVPLLRPVSVVLLDVSVRRIQDDDWANEYDRPMYFVELRDGYRCGWFHQDGMHLLCNPLLYPAVCPRFGGYWKKSKWSAVWWASLLG